MSWMYTNMKGLTHVAPIIDIALRPPLVSLCKQWTVPLSDTGTGLVSSETLGHLCGRESSLILPVHMRSKPICVVRRRPRSSSPSIFSRTPSSPASSPHWAEAAPDRRRVMHWTSAGWWQLCYVAWSPLRVADCPSWHPFRSMGLMSMEPTVELPAAVWCAST